MSAAAITNPYIAVSLQWIGGLGAAGFYLPFFRVRDWSWETYWLIGGVFSWIIAPVAVGVILIPGIIRLFEHLSPDAIFWTYLFGVLWGCGSLTFGLTLRYLGIGLGMTVALGYTAVFGTLIPPIINGSVGELSSHVWGLLTLLGIVVSVAGIALTGVAGWSKERELPDETRKAVVREYRFLRGIVVATFSGIMSSFINFGLVGLDGFNAVHGQNVITTKAAHLLIGYGHGIASEGLPALIVVLAGGFTTNVIWCTILHIKNHSGGEYIGAVAELSILESGLEKSADQGDYRIAKGYPDIPLSRTADHDVRKSTVPLLKNYAFSALAGLIWYVQFFCYTAGQSFMPRALAFSGWTLHMASVIMFATFLGVVRHEWRGASKRTQATIASGVGLLIVSTLIIGGGSFLKSNRTHCARGIGTILCAARR